MTGCRQLFVSVAVLSISLNLPSNSLRLMAADADKPALELHRGDHICIIGNTLADRMQHDGWLETLLHARFPRHELVVRNLGFSGDELTVRRARAKRPAIQPSRSLAGVVELVDTRDLGSRAARRGGSSPSARTRRKWK